MPQTPVPTRVNFDWPEDEYIPKHHTSCSNIRPQLLPNRERNCNDLSKPQMRLKNASPPSRLQLVLGVSELDHKQDQDKNDRCYPIECRPVSFDGLDSSLEDGIIETSIFKSDNESFSNDELYESDYSSNVNETILTDMDGDEEQYLLAHKQFYYQQIRESLRFTETVNDIDIENIKLRSKTKLGSRKSNMSYTRFEPLDTDGSTNVDQSIQNSEYPVVVETKHSLSSTDPVANDNTELYLDRGFIIRPNIQYSEILACLYPTERFWASRVSRCQPINYRLNYRETRKECKQISSLLQKSSRREIMELKQDLISQIDQHANGVGVDEHIMYQLSCVCLRSIKDFEEQNNLPYDPGKIPPTFITYRYSKSMLKSQLFKQIFKFCIDVIDERNTVLDVLGAYFPDKKSKLEKLLVALLKLCRTVGIEKAVEMLQEQRDGETGKYDKILIDSINLIDSCVYSLTKNIGVFVKTNKMEYVTQLLEVIRASFLQTFETSRGFHKNSYKNMMRKKVMCKFLNYFHSDFARRYEESLYVPIEDCPSVYEDDVQLKEEVWAKTRRTIVCDILQASEAEVQNKSELLSKQAGRILSE